MTNDNMIQLRKIELELLDYVVDLCKEFNLNYYLLYGTLLGSVRHDGFIPWDDDIDIGLPRSDYNKLCEVLEKKCNTPNSSYFFQSTKTEINFSLPFSKLRKNNTIFLEKDYEMRNINHGIFIDIFPLDKARKKKGIQKFLSFIIYRLYKYGSRLNSISLIDIAQILLTLYEKKECNYFISYGSPYSVDVDIVEIEWFTRERYGTFEGKKYRIPYNYDAYLKSIYGDDYMKVPPAEKRRTHNPVALKFEN